MTVHKVPNKGYYARVGDFFGPMATSPKDALKALDNELEAFHPLNHVYLTCVNMTVLHIFQIPSHGWNVNIVPPEGYAGQGIGVQGTLAEAKAKATAWADLHAGGLYASGI